MAVGHPPRQTSRMRLAIASLALILVGCSSEESEESQEPCHHYDDAAVCCEGVSITHSGTSLCGLPCESHTFCRYGRWEDDSYRCTDDCHRRDTGAKDTRGGITDTSPAFDDADDVGDEDAADAGDATTAG